MPWGYILVVLILILLLFWRMEKWLIKKFKIDRGKGWIYRSINNVHRAGETALFIMFWVVLAAGIIFSYSPGIIAFIYSMVLGLFRAFMEWKYVRETRRHILSLFGVVVSGFFLLALIAMPFFV
ncbi:DUF4181 domain-containing protein [Metabacillus sp. FJAT-52054]|uniref:DUF4181 domain-containing protein n=1 Tax=Metabacillus sediminis TaxID=3117746 RepID=A0ABZ2NKA3_9BACI